MDSRWGERRPLSGKVTYYDPKANIGFIRPDDGSADVIFSIRPYDEPVEAGDYVYYDLQPALQVTEIGKQALHVRRAVPNARRSIDVPPTSEPEGVIG